MLSASSSATEARHAERRGLFLSAILLADGRSWPIRIRNISASGAMIEGVSLPENGVVEIRRADHRLLASVIWAGGKQRGIRFDGTVDLGDWIPSVGMQGQRLVDARIAMARSAPVQAVEENDDSLPIIARVGEELKLASRRLERTLDRLSDFAPLVQRNGVELQELEVLQQLLVRLAEVIEADEPIDAARRIGMDEVRRRLLR